MRINERVDDLLQGMPCDSPMSRWMWREEILWVEERSKQFLYEVVVNSEGGRASLRGWAKVRAPALFVGAQRHATSRYSRAMRCAPFQKVQELPRSPELFFTQLNQRGAQRMRTKA
jgi:hypothetical protein